jgi:hypothetical protein
MRHSKRIKITSIALFLLFISFQSHSKTPQKYKFGISPQYLYDSENSSTFMPGLLYKTQNYVFITGPTIPLVYDIKLNQTYSSDKKNRKIGFFVGLTKTFEFAERNYNFNWSTCIHSYGLEKDYETKHNDNDAIHSIDESSYLITTGIGFEFNVLERLDITCSTGAGIERITLNESLHIPSFNQYIFKNKNGRFDFVLNLKMGLRFYLF